MSWFKRKPTPVPAPQPTPVPVPAPTPAPSFVDAFNQGHLDTSKWMAATAY